jgi:hypothetical protein
MSTDTDWYHNTDEDEEPERRNEPEGSYEQGEANAADEEVAADTEATDASESETEEAEPELETESEIESEIEPNSESESAIEPETEPAIEPEPEVEQPEPAAMGTGIGAATATDMGVARPQDLGGDESGADPLVPVQDRDEFLSRWTRIQISFVEDPAAAVESAETLVREIGDAMLAGFRTRSSEFAAAGGAAVDTESKRLALRRYRSFIGVILPE